ncbi:MAG: hypothetical protein LBI19_04385 [Oscillospiraceae bacterium]|nr:hypothetical protein [Oscillospiraceae bacterium]
MKTKRLAILLMATFLTLTLWACDSGLRMIDMEIESYPDKLIYVISMDNELNLDGGTIRITAKENAGNAVVEMSAESRISHDIDFTKEGIYVVSITRGSEFSVSFPIQVVSLETLDHIVHANMG